jgi:hypothetical protein
LTMDVQGHGTRYWTVMAGRQEPVVITGNWKTQIAKGGKNDKLRDLGGGGVVQPCG